jgi:hypothetical protein
MTKPISVQCFNCKYITNFEKFEINPVTESKVCPECGYEGGKLTPNDPSDHQDEWDNLFKDD